MPTEDSFAHVMARLRVGDEDAALGVNTVQREGIMPG
jgi:hypothetical protein